MKAKEAMSADAPIKVGPLTFIRKNLKDLDFGKPHGKESDDRKRQRDEEPRRIEGFKIAWKDIPKFAVITGINGSGKSHMLEKISQIIADNNAYNFRVVYIGPNEVEKFDLNSDVYTEVFLPTFKEREELINFVVKHIRGEENDYRSKGHSAEKFKFRTEELSASLTAKHKDLKNKEDKELKEIIDSECNRPTFTLDVKDLSEILKIIKASIKSYNDAKHTRMSELFNYSKILDEPYEFWKTQNPGKTLEDFKVFLKDQQKVDVLLAQLVSKEFPSDPLKEINKIFPESFPYQLIEHDKKIYCYPRNLGVNDIRDMSKYVQLAHLSSGEKMIMKVVSLVFYNQGFKSDTASAGGAFTHKPDIILLDEPDKHLDPRSCRVFFDAVQKILVEQEGIQVIMTTHRLDTVALAPEASIYTIKNHEVVKSHKLQAMFRMSSNLRGLVDYHHKVYTESTTDAQFYEGVYHSLKHYSDEIRKRSLGKGDYFWYLNAGETIVPRRFLSNRYTLSFYAVSDDGKGNGGCGSVIGSVKREINAYQNLATGELRGQGIIVSARWQQCRKLFSSHELYRPFGIIDNDYEQGYEKIEREKAKIKSPVVAAGISGVMVIKTRHSVDNFIFDPLIFCMVLSEEEIREYVENSNIRGDTSSVEALIQACLNIKSAVINKNYTNLQADIEKYFSTILRKMSDSYSHGKVKKCNNDDMAISIYDSMRTKIESHSTVCDKEIEIITSHDRTLLLIKYPEEFLLVRGHDIEDFFKDSSRFSYKPADMIIQRIYSEGIEVIPLDLADIMFELNSMVRANVRSVIKSGEPDPQPNAMSALANAATVSGPKSSTGVPMMVKDLYVNAAMFDIQVIEDLPEREEGQRYLLIDSDNILQSVDRDYIDTVCFNIQGDTASCGDNALLIARKAQMTDFKTSIYIVNNHAVALILYDSDLDYNQVLQEVNAIELNEDTGLWKKYLDVMTGDTLYIGNSTEAVLQEFSRIIKDITTSDTEDLGIRIESLLAKIDCQNTTELHIIKEVLQRWLEQLNEKQALEYALDSQSPEGLYDKIIGYIETFANSATPIVKEALQSLLWSLEVGFLEHQSDVHFPPYYHPGKPDDDPLDSFGGWNTKPDDYGDMIISGNNTNTSSEVFYS